MKRWLAGAVAIAALGIPVWLSIAGGDGVSNGGRGSHLPVPVPRTQVAALGRVEPRSEEMQIAAAMTGRLASVEVDEGDPIRCGQVLATLENADHRARVRGAEASLAIARASLDRLINGARQAERDQAEAEVREAEAVLALAEQELERQQGLARRDLGSRQDLDRARSEQQVALARLARVRFQREVIESPPRADEQARAEAEVALAEARLAEARAVLDKSFVRSPVDGMVLRKLRHAGELVTEMLETPIVTVGDLSVLRVRAEVDEADIALVRPGQCAYVRADAYGERRFAGHVSRVGVLVGRKGLRSERPDERLDTRVLEVLVDLDPGSDLPVGLRVDTYFVLDSPDSVKGD
ncbi:HlyD family secretion protein [Imhoffiella purpurea]|uniref:Secretion protein HlyD n=1 Tax=Imhoffiella purpurea TaxID=1249627 RepID=W9VJW2_9GAMM|nr:efflux RND transporter periplasmic adaptor subunit [Imhoffiella purpurea]EXJ16357.1 secretion protein HlyD [Imhoffiella purpurea]